MPPALNPPETVGTVERNASPRICRLLVFCRFVPWYQLLMDVFMFVAPARMLLP